MSSPGLGAVAVDADLSLTLASSHGTLLLSPLKPDILLYEQKIDDAIITIKTIKTIKTITSSQNIQPCLARAFCVEASGTNRRHGAPSLLAEPGWDPAIKLRKYSI